VTRRPARGPDPELSAAPYLARGPGVAPLATIGRRGKQDILVERLPPGSRPARELAPITGAALVRLLREIAYVAMESWPMVETIRPELVYVTTDRAGAPRLGAIAYRGPMFLAGGKACYPSTGRTEANARIAAPVHAASFAICATALELASGIGPTRGSPTPWTPAARAIDNLALRGLLQRGCSRDLETRPGPFELLQALGSLA
jgi:hypothetical protein